jgi:hypothetical protein
MNRQDAEKLAEELSEKKMKDTSEEFGTPLFNLNDVRQTFVDGYLQAYDDLKAEMCKVPWTEEEAKEKIKMIEGYWKPSNGVRESGKLWEYGLETGAKSFYYWAEKRIKERG